MDSMIYPTFELDKERGFLPRVCLPRNFKELVPVFYGRGGREKFEKYVRDFEKLCRESSFASELEVRLNWDEKEGLRNISLGIHAGFDLNDSGWPNFQEHNLGMHYSLIAGAIAQKYVSELLKCQ